ncbi:MAG: sialate O-acetylesterase [Planctomycetota bacterium]
MRERIWCIVFGLVWLGAAAPAAAEMQVPSVIGSNMVLQRNADVAVWGWDRPGTDVTVRFRGRRVTSEADQDGKFLLRVPSGEAGGPFTLTIDGSESRTLGNVMVGEVWVAGGQSNMWWQMSGVQNAQQEIAEATKLPNVRFYDGNTGPREGGWRREEPQRDIPDARWQTPSPKSVPSWASTAYFFARDLHRELGVPVGIVHIAVPGQKIQLFMSARQTARQLPEIWAEHEAALAAYPDKVAEHEKEVAEWKAKGGEGEKPRAPRRPLYEVYWNGMVRPVAPFTATGFIWWQGESNANQAGIYDRLQRELVRQWRSLWDDPDMPFILVELANFGPPSRPTVSQDAPWPRLREAQRRAASDEVGIYLVSVIDIKQDPPAEAHWQIHPARKQIAGHRLFRAAMTVAYGEKDRPGFGP